MIVSFDQKKCKTDMNNAYHILEQIEDDMEEIYEEIYQATQNNMGKANRNHIFVQHKSNEKQNAKDTDEMNAKLKKMKEMITQIEHTGNEIKRTYKI